jgi:hypothetical protein
MKTNEILSLDIREPDNEEKIQRVLRKIKPFSKYQDKKVPISKIEKFIKTICEKYNIGVQAIYLDCINGDNVIIYHSSIINTETYQWIGNVFGITLYDVASKTSIKLYSEVKSGRISRKD